MNPNIAPPNCLAGIKVLDLFTALRPDLLVVGRGRRKPFGAKQPGEALRMDRADCIFHRLHRPDVGLLVFRDQVGLRIF